MKYLFAAIIAVTAVALQINGDETMDQRKQQLYKKFFETAEKCAKDAKTDSAALLESLKTYQPKSEYKCDYKCLLKNMNFMDKDGILTLPDLTPASIRECIALGSDTDQCETAHKAITCWAQFKNNQKS